MRESLCMQCRIAGLSAVILLIKIAASLTALSIAGQVVNQTLVKGVPGREWLGHPIRFFDLNRERNVPTWYQGLTLLLSGAILWGIAAATARGVPGALEGLEGGDARGPRGARQGGCGIGAGSLRSSRTSAATKCSSGTSGRLTRCGHG